MKLTKQVATYCPQLIYVPGQRTWIIGSSLVHWASCRAKVRRKAVPALSKPSTSWHGERGMRWKQLLPKVRSLLKEEQPPQILLLHLGGNDLVSTSLRMLIQEIKKDLSKIKQLMPNTRILWSDIVARIQYRGAKSNAKTEKARKSLNSTVHAHISKLDGLCIRHPQINWTCTELYRNDGVHLSKRGNDALLQNWHYYVV